MTTPRELSADEIAAIRERADEAHSWVYFDIGTETDASTLVDAFATVHTDLQALLAIVDALTARCRAYEAALRPFAELLPRYAEYVAECHEEGIIASNFTGWVDWFGWSSDEMKAN